MILTQKIIIFSRVDMAADMAGAKSRRHMAVYVHATWRMCMHVYARVRVCTCAYVCACVISEIKHPF